MNGDIKFEDMRRLNRYKKLASNVLVHFRGRDDDRVKQKYLKYKKKYLILLEKYNSFM